MLHLMDPIDPLGRSINEGRKLRLNEADASNEGHARYLASPPLNGSPKEVSLVKVQQLIDVLPRAGKSLILGIGVNPERILSHNGQLSR